MSSDLVVRQPISLIQGVNYPKVLLNAGMSPGQVPVIIQYQGINILEKCISRVLSI